jgi:hypothetical protein
MTSLNGPLPFDQDAARTFLNLLGKQPHETRLRGFLPSGHQLKSRDSGRKGAFSSDSVVAWQQEGRGVYVVINNGGDTDAQITSCNALFCEWDDRDVSWQITAWRELNLPEPSFIVLTGGKSAHLYWRFTSPIAVETWRDLQTRLLEYADADRTLKNPSRVMRLPGAWHLGPDGSPNSQTVILGQPSGRSYTSDVFEHILPSPQVVQEQAAARAYRVPLDFPSHSLSEIQDALAFIPSAVPNQKQYAFYRNLMWGLIRACEEVGGTADDAIAFMSAHSPRFAEVRQVARSAFSHVNASTFWYWAQHHGYKSPKLSAGFDAFHPAQRKADNQEAAEAAELSYTDLIDLLVEAYRISDINAEVELTAQIKGRFRRSDGQIISSVMRALTPHSEKNDAVTVNLDDVHSLEYAADGWVIANKPQLLYASYGGGKTTLIVEKAIAICEGRSLVERRTITHPPGAALIIATDSGLQALKTTIQQLQYDDHPALDPTNPRLFLWGQCTEQGMDAWVADVPGILKLRRFVEEYGIKYVAVDSVKTVCAGGGFSYLDNDSVNNFIALIDRTICEPLNCCVEFVSHTGTEKGSHSGAKAWAEAPSMVCRLTPAYEETSQDGGQTADRKQIGVKAEFLKDRASMGGQRVVSYTLREAQGLLEPLPDVEVVGSCRDVLRAALEDAHARGLDGLRVAELVSAGDKAGRSYKTVINTLSAMAAGHRPEVIRPRGKRGKYALAPRSQKLTPAQDASNESRQEEEREIKRESPLGGDQNQQSGQNTSKSQSTTGVSQYPDFIPTPLSHRDKTAEIPSAATEVAETSVCPDFVPTLSRSSSPDLPHPDPVCPDSPDRDKAISPEPPATTDDSPLLLPDGERDLARVHTPARALYVDDSPLLEPLPIHFDEEAHRYRWLPTETWLAFSVTKIAAASKSPAAMARIRETQHIWEPRGKHVHSQLEAFLKGQPIDLGDYAEWVEPLLAHPMWKKLKPLAAEHRLADPDRSIAGTLDALCEHENGAIVLLDLKTQGSATSSPYSTNAQMGGYASMLPMHYPLMVDRCVTIWARPGATELTFADPATCIAEWEAKRDAFIAENVDF